MIGPFEHIETFDPAPFLRVAGGAFGSADVAEDLRPLQILYALAAEIRPRAAVACLEVSSSRQLSGATVLVAALNAGFFEEAHFVTRCAGVAFHEILALARIPRRVHVYQTAPLFSEVDFWIVDPRLRARALDTLPALVAEIPPGAITEPDSAAVARAENADLRLFLHRERLNEDIIRFAQDLMSTKQKWWESSGGAGSRVHGAGT